MSVFLFGVSVWGRRLGAGARGVGLTTCRCCASVPLSILISGRPVNSPGDWSPGPITSVGLKQHRACIPDIRTACGKQSESPTPLDPAPKRLTTEKYRKTDFGREKVLVVEGTGGCVPFLGLALGRLGLLSAKLLRWIEEALRLSAVRLVEKAQK